MNHAIGDELLECALKNLVRVECGNLAAILEHLAEFDRRRIAERKAYQSTFEYCARVLGYSEQEAYKRIYAARLSREYPLILRLVADGRLHLSGLQTVGPHLNDRNQEQLLAAACGKTRRDLEILAAGLAGSKAEPRDSIKVIAVGASATCKEDLGRVGPLFAPLAERGGSPCDGRVLAADAGGGGPCDGGAPDAHDGGGCSGNGGNGGAGSPGVAAAASSASSTPETGRVRFAFVGSARLLAKVERARQRFRHRYPAGRLEDLVEAAFDALLEKSDLERGGPAIRRPSLARARRIPRWVRKTVWLRDGGRCTYVSEDGLRCGARSFLQFDHVAPWALGGASNDPANVRLLCRSHNLLLARDVFGPSRRASDILQGASTPPGEGSDGVEGAAGASGNALCGVEDLYGVGSAVGPSRNAQGGTKGVAGPSGNEPGGLKNDVGALQEAADASKDAQRPP